MSECLSCHALFSSSLDLDFDLRTQAIAEALCLRVFVKADKLRILDCLEDAALTKMLTRDSLHAGLHVLPMHLINKKSLMDYLRPLKSRFDNVLALKPTGWTFDDHRGDRYDPLLVTEL